MEYKLIQSHYQSNLIKLRVKMFLLNIFILII
jgi:hypothetical protein